MEGSVAEHFFTENAFPDKATGCITGDGCFVEVQHTDFQAVTSELLETEITDQRERFFSVSASSVGPADHHAELGDTVFPVQADNAAASDQITVHVFHSELVFAAGVAGLLGEPLLLIVQGCRKGHALIHEQGSFLIIDKQMIGFKISAFKRAKADELSLQHLTNHLPNRV